MQGEKMKITNVKNNPAMENPHKVTATKIHDSDHAAVIHMTLNPGQSLKPHTTPGDVFFYILEGEPTVEIGTERERVPADSIVDSPANIKHCIYNETDKTARFIVVKFNK